MVGGIYFLPQSKCCVIIVEILRNRGREYDFDGKAVGISKQAWRASRFEGAWFYLRGVGRILCAGLPHLLSYFLLHERNTGDVLFQHIQRNLFLLQHICALLSEQGEHGFFYNCL